MNHNQHTRIHYYNFSFFEQIKTEMQAYWLGFLYADGCVHKNKITIGLAIKDKCHLVRFCQDIGLENPKFFKSEKTKSIRVTLSCKKMAIDLEKIGCVPRKTYLLEFPNFLPENLLSHFIRGYFDGDGGVSVRKDGRKCSVTIVGREDFLKKLKEKINVGHIYKTSSDKVKCISICSKKQIDEFYNFIYKNANVFLDRKKKKIEFFQKSQLPNKIKTSSQVGVYFKKERFKWVAFGYKNNKYINLGSFSTEEEAIKKRQEFEKHKNEINI